MLLDTPRTSRLEEYMKDCVDKIAYHRSNASNALRLNNILSFVVYSFSALQTMTMALLSVYEQDAKTTGVVGACFGFLNGILGKSYISFSFDTLNILHNMVADDYAEVLEKFKLMQLNEDYDEYEFKSLVMRMLSIQEKGHLQSIKDCYARKLCCCF